MLPEAKLDILLAHHAALENELLGQVSSERYVQITRELAELNPLIDAVKAYRGVQAELAGTEALLADGGNAAEALNSGYHLAYLIGAGLVLAGIPIAVGVLRDEAPEAVAEPVPVPDRPALTVNYLPASSASPCEEAGLRVTIGCGGCTATPRRGLVANESPT